MAKILLVEDENDLAQLMKSWLQMREHHLVETLDDGLLANTTIQVNKFDLIILDITLPGMSGLEICQQYRKMRGMTPILLVSARSEIEDKERGLDAGADDYLTKPFALKELAARARALLRRGPSLASNQLSVRDIVIDPVEYTVTKSGEQVHMLPQEFRLLEFFARHPNQVFGPADLLASVWESDSSAMLDTVRGHVKRIRRKLDSPHINSIITNVYGVGYKLEA